MTAEDALFNGTVVESQTDGVRIYEGSTVGADAGAVLTIEHALWTVLSCSRRPGVSPDGFGIFDIHVRKLTPGEVAVWEVTVS